MRITITANSAYVVAHFRLDLVRALVADGHDVTALVPPDRYTAVLEGAGCSVVPLRMEASSLSPFTELRQLLAMRRAFLRLRPDAIVSFTIKNNIYGALVAPLGVPVLPNVTGLGTAFLSSDWLARVAVILYKYAFAKPPAVFFQNRDDRDLFVRNALVRPDQVRMLPGSGIDLDLYAPIDLPGDVRAPVFVMIARLLRDKGVVEYAEAARKLVIERPGTQFLLIGPLGSSNRTALDRRIVDGWVREGAIKWLGAVDDVRPYIASADVVVLPSYREGLPRTLLEGAAMARPLVATDVPGCRDLVEEGVTGFLCEAGNADDLVRAMRAMIDLGPEHRRKMGRAGRRLVEQSYDVRRVIDIYRHTLAEVVGGRGDVY